MLGRRVCGENGMERVKNKYVNMVYSYVWEDDFLRAGVLKGLTTEGQFRNPKFD